MIRVYHDKNFLNNAFGNKNPKVDTLYLVAEVDAKDLEMAYMLTNNIDVPWIENEGVTPHGDKHRSSSCGDVFEQNGKFFVVASCGFREVEHKNYYAGLLTAAESY